MAEALCNTQGLKVPEMLARLGAEFPEATKAEVSRAFGIAHDEMTERAKRYEAETEELIAFAKSRGITA
jgi:hypothetical protein